MSRLIFLCSLLLCFAVASPAQTIVGVAVVVDGDTLRLGSERIRLYGIDAPEMAQSCGTHDGALWPCGAASHAALAARLAGQTTRCEGVERDRYGRLVARCFVAGQDVGAALVVDGLAFAYAEYSSDYIDLEKQAMFAGVGVWQGPALRPAIFRAQGRAVSKPSLAPPQQTCLIKGNISANGRIAHSPGQVDYARTQIDQAKGERWFCSAAEAQAAGWRLAKR
jgi:endonuclease YncB( thermonuclease family)